MLLLPLLLGCAPGGAGDAPDTGDSADSGDTGGEACDPTVPNVDLPSFTADREILRLVLDPQDIDPETDNFPGSDHVLHVPDDPDIPLRDELLVFLPGTGNHPDAFDEVAEVAARAGYPVAVLAWDSETHPGEDCLVEHPDTYEACRTAAFQEKAYGTDTSDVEDVGEADSVVGRLVRLLAHLDERYPEAGAGRFLDSGAPRWESIAIAGFSQGALMAGLLSGEHAMARAVLLAGGCDGVEIDGEITLAAWCFEPRATPAERTWALSHVRDEANEDLAIHEAYGLPALGDYADAGLQSPDYCTGTHLLSFDLPSAGDDATRYHLSVAHDEFLPVDADGVPVLAEDYHWLFTAG